MITILAILSLIIGSVFLWEIVGLLRATPPKSSKTTFINKSHPDEEHNIPKIIWSYWHQAELPYVIQKCKENWERFAPDHQIHFLNQDTIFNWIDRSELIAIFDQLPAYRQADWLRLQLLKKYGGVWVDASIIFTESLDWLHKLQKRNNAEYAGFYIEGFTNIPTQPMIENWFMASIPKAVFIENLSAEFEKAIILGEKKYLDNLRTSDQFPRIVQNLDVRSQEYLIMHVAASVLLNQPNHPYSFALLCAEDSAFAYHAALRWRKRHLYIKLGILKCPTNLPPLIKIRGSDRRVLERGVSAKKISENSFLTKYLLVEKS